MAERNAAPVADFDGLSSDAMQRLLCDPFGDASPLVVADVPRVAPRSPLLHLVLDLAQALGEGGLRATDKGNLPRVFVLAALERYEAAGWGVDPLHRVRNEEDFRDLHAARLVARMAGLVTLRRGRWHATQAYRHMWDRSGAAGVYVALFRAFVTKYAWNWTDRLPDLDIVQRSWGFTLLQLLRHGDPWRGVSFYTDRFVRAFPAAIDFAASEGAGGWVSPEETVQLAYQWRVLKGFARFLGLAERVG